MSEVTLEHIKSEQARVSALIAQFEKRSLAVEYVVDRAVIPLQAGARLAGPVFKDDGTLDYYLILHAGDGGELPHDEAKAYAAGRGLKLPNRREGRLLQANCPDVCSSATIWLEDDYEPDPAYGWVQYYTSGGQGNGHKSAEFLAVAVSRFTPSVI